MSQTLINTNQNQINNQTGSYVELIKNTGEAKKNLANTLAEKGQDVSSLTTLEEMVNATKDLKTLDGFSIITGNGSQGGQYSGYSMFAHNTQIRNTAKGMFGFIRSSNYAGIYVYNCDTNYYNNATSLYYKVLSTVSSGGYGAPLFYVNEAGTKMWMLGTDKKTIYEYALDYSGVDEQNPVNINITETQTITLATALTSYASGVFSVNEEAHKILLNNGANYNDSFSYSKIVDYSSSTTDLPISNITATGADQFTDSSGNGQRRIFPISRDYFITFGISKVLQLSKMDWGANTISLVKTLNSGQDIDIICGHCFSSITINNRQCLPYIKHYTNNAVQRNTLHLLYLNDLSEDIFDFNGGYCSSARWTTAVCSTLPHYINNTTYLSGGVFGSYYKLSIINDKVNVEFYPCRTNGFVYSNTYNATANITDPILSLSNNKIIYLFGESSYTLNSETYTMYRNKILAYIYKDKQIFFPMINWSTDPVLDIPSSEQLLEDE